MMIWKEKRLLLRYQEKLTAALIQKLLLSNPEDYVENDYPYVMNKTGIIGCNKEELDYLEKYLVEGSIEYV